MATGYGRHQGLVVKLTKDGVGDERSHGGDHGQQGEHLSNLVLCDALRHQRPEERELAMADRSEALDEVELPIGLEQTVNVYNRTKLPKESSINNLTQYLTILPPPPYPIFTLFINRVLELPLRP